MTERKRILIFIDWFLPGEKAGGPVRSCANLMEQLGNEFDFSVVTADTDYTDHIPYKNIKSDQWNILPDGKRVYYISKGELKKETIEKIILDEKPGMVYLNGIWSQAFTHWPLRIAKKNKIRTVVAVRGMLAPSALAIRKTKKNIFLLLAKLGRLFSAVTFHATTEKEKEETRKIFGKVNVLVAGNLPRRSIVNAIAKDKKRDKLRLITVARIAPEKNILFALESLRHVTANVAADFYGPVYDHSYWKECEAMARQLPACVNVEFHEAVDSDSIPALMSAHDVLFLPTRGENFGHVIIEAMQNGLPVLISDKTPWKFLAKNYAGWDLPLNDAKTFARKINEIAEMDERAFRPWTEGAVRFAVRYASDTKLMESNRKIFS
ncbi:MAG: glycosyltransferase family 4 protein [Bacteroidetes bacterium]|nr:glycosyltransferase family 4 protein [Bacteroidota bacterium]